MSEHKQRLPRIALAVFVLLTASAVGAFFGWVGGSMYVEKPEHAWLAPLGMAVGLAGGCITACLWLMAMFHEMSKPQPELIIRRGIVFGMLAGLLTATFLHTALIAVTHMIHMIRMAATCIVLAGVPAGFLVGLAGGLAAWAVVKWGQRHG